MSDVNCVLALVTELGTGLTHITQKKGTISGNGNYISQYMYVHTYLTYFLRDKIRTIRDTLNHNGRIIIAITITIIIIIFERRRASVSMVQHNCGTTGRDTPATYFWTTAEPCVTSLYRARVYFGGTSLLRKVKAFCAPRRKLCSVKSREEEKEMRNSYRKPHAGSKGKRRSNRSWLFYKGDVRISRLVNSFSQFTKL